MDKAGPVAYGGRQGDFASPEMADGETALVKFEAVLMFGAVLPVSQRNGSSS
jgi:hypothetical protein